MEVCVMVSLTDKAAEKVRELGVKPSKTLPTGLLDNVADKDD